MSGILALFCPEIRYALIDGFFGAYRISDHGLLETCVKHTGFHKYEISNQWRPLRLSADKDGYLFTTLSYGGQKKHVYIHKLVCFYFNGPRPGPEYEVAHNTPDRSDNRAISLRWDTHSGNLQDMVPHDTHRRGERSHTAKLTWESVREIRARGGWRVPNRVPVKILAREYGVEPATIRRILNWETWIEECEDAPTRVFMEV